MKAILVIDMPDEDLKDYFANVEIFKEGVLRFSADDLACPYRLHQRFKPLPQKKDIYERIYQAYGLGNDEIYQRIRQEVEDIYDEILGGNDE